LPVARDPEIVASGQWKIGLDYAVTNHFSHTQTSQEAVRFDGESQRTTISVTRGWGDDWQLSLQVPFVRYSGGSLDGFIESWHNFFGLPQNGRKQTPRNQLHFFYQKNGKVLLDFTEPTSAIGDAQLIYARKIHATWFAGQHNLSFKTAIKFPTGDSEKLTGSGAMALSAWITADGRTTWFGLPGMTYGSAGAMLLQQGDVLPDQQRDYALFGGLGTGLQVNNSIVLQTQLDVHSSLYHDSGLREINSVAIQFTMGGNIKLNNALDMDIGVVEDLLPQASPDVIFHLGVNGRW